MDPKIRKLVFGMLEAAEKQQLDSYLAGYDPAELVELLKVGFSIFIEITRYQFYVESMS